jgi:D-glycero-D-manno-heptose 1,7-bisphosphate phosphatase
MANNNGQKAVFIDRDGTLVEEVNFLSRTEDLRLFPYTRESIELLKEHGFIVVVVTNQSGIARNKYNEADMHAIHEAIQDQLSGALNGFYFCPHLPNEGCECRKPNLGMINAACSDFSIDMENSWMIGDKKLDVETGKNAGIRTAMVMTGYGRDHVTELERQPDIVAENLLDAVKIIVSV